jgi:hypothetical protein
MRANRGDPVGVKGFFDELQFAIAQVRRRKQNWFYHFTLIVTLYHR